MHLDSKPQQRSPIRYYPLYAGLVYAIICYEDMYPLSIPDRNIQVSYLTQNNNPTYVRLCWTGRQQVSSSISTKLQIPMTRQCATELSFHGT
jgi:hypothetical protein